MKILVTGGCGFIGSNLAARLVSDGHDVTVLDNESLGKRDYIANLGLRFISGDISDEAIMDLCLPGQETVVHLAADTRVMDSIAEPTRNFETNVVGTFRLLRAAQKHGIRNFINASTGGAIIGEAPPPVHEGMVPHPMSPYGASKLCTEAYCDAFSGTYGLKTISLRFTNVYGPGSFHKGSVIAHFFKNILNSKPLTVFGDGTQTRDFLYIGDLLNGVAAAIASDRTGVLQLGSGTPTSLNDLIGHVGDIVGKNISVKYEAFRPGEVVHTWADIGKARDALAFTPRMSLPEGLSRTWSWFTQNRERAG